MHLEVVVAPTHADLLPMLRSGKGDFVAAFMTPTPDRIDSLVTFSNPYFYASEVIVGRASESPMDSPADFAGQKRIAGTVNNVRQTSPPVDPQDTNLVGI